MIVDRLYRCHCGKTERYRAKDNIPQYAHYCMECYDLLDFDTALHCEPVFLREEK